MSISLRVPNPTQTREGKFGASDHCPIPWGLNELRSIAHSREGEEQKSWVKNRKALGFVSAPYRSIGPAQSVTESTGIQWLFEIGAPHEGIKRRLERTKPSQNADEARNRGMRCEIRLVLSVR